MCYAILRVSYRNGTEASTLREVTSEDELNKAVEELTSREGVKQVTTFLPHLSRELVSEWKCTYAVPAALTVNELA